jgi:hypothetical protein
MNNLVLGISTIVSCSLLCYLAFRFAAQGRYSIALPSILVCAGLLRVFVSLDPELHTWDERYHALVGKHVFEDPLKPTLYKNPVLPYDHKNWTGNHIWLEKGPVPLFCIGASVHFLGTNSFAVRLPSIIVGCMAVLLTFFIGKFLFDERIGLLAAFLHAIHGLSLELVGGRVSSDHVETFYGFFIELAFFFVVYFLAAGRRKTMLAVLIGVAAGLAILTKWFPALVIFPVWILAAAVSKKFRFHQIAGYAALSVFACLAVVVPYFWFLHSAYPEEFSWVMNKFLFAYSDPVENHAAPWYYYLQMIGVLFGELVLIPLLIGLVLVFREQRKWQLMLLTAWWLIPLVIFSLADTKRSTYLMLAAPAVFILIAFTVFYLWSAPAFKVRKLIPVVLIAALLLLPVRYSFERIKFFESRPVDQAWRTDLATINALNYDRRTTVIFNVERAVEAMFYTGFTIYRNMPAPEVAAELDNRGYTVLYYNAGSAEKIMPFRDLP